MDFRCARDLRPLNHEDTDKCTTTIRSRTTKPVHIVFKFVYRERINIKR